MGTVTLRSPAGADKGSVELPGAVFGIQPNVPVMHQVVTAQLAKRRAGTQSTKTRSEVSGGGRKPFKQKGTGNARQGSTRAPQWAGGAVALGPKPRSYDQRTPKKMIRLALHSALSDRANAGKVVVVDGWDFSAPRTKDAAKALRALGIDGKALVVVARDDKAAMLSFRNLPDVQLILASELNAYDVLCNEWVVFTNDTIPSGAGAEVGRHAVRGDQPEALSERREAGAQRSAASEASTQHPYGPGSHSPLADVHEAPDGYDIKGNAQSMLYHVPGSRYYKATKAEVWFTTEEAAAAAGFAKPGSQSDDEGDDGATTEGGDEG
jgi:large subunit ribosomal protein L4